MADRDAGTGGDPSPSHGERPSPEGPYPRGTDRARAASWTLGLGLCVLGLLLAVGLWQRAPTTELRTRREVELKELIRQERARTDALAAQVQRVSTEVRALERRQAVGLRTATLRDRLDDVAAPAGLTAVTGPGLSVTLDDAPADADASSDANDLVIHEQDLQVVVNALWAGGAEAMTINGQRLLATSGVRCVGNTLLLHGQNYSPPYTVKAIGDSEALRTALDRDPAVAVLRSAVERYGLGYSVEQASQLRLPASGGPSAMQVAEPVQEVGA
jgi:uncharacterized protein YlxW (UPF0749 family)